MNGYDVIEIGGGSPGEHCADVGTNREATGMKAVPCWLIVLGAGPVGVETAQAVRRLGGEVVLTGHGEGVLPREPAQLGSGARRSPAPRRDRPTR